jgi:polyisoprenyl-teichoic acid--peptidoglycan teichoic acid transferase
MTRLRTRRSGWSNPPRSPAVAAVLSFLWPGLGQWYAGQPRTAVLFAVPISAIMLLLLVWLARGLEWALLDLLSAFVAVGFIVLVLAEGAWRIAALVHAAWLTGGRHGFRKPSVGGAVVVLTLLVVVSHLWAAAVAWSLYEGWGRVYVPPVAGPVVVLPVASGAATPGSSILPSVQPTPEVVSRRINTLVTGIDSSAIRNHALTDTLIVVSVDPDTGAVAMVSFPRDIARFRMSNGKLFTAKINSLMVEADKDPTRYPGGGLPTLTRELGYLLGVPIQYYAAVDLEGFARLIDTVGGVTIDNPKAINDPSYGGWTDGRIGFHLSAGVHRLDGQTALAYARSRRGAGDNDFTRARRQQQLLVALRDRLTDPALLPKMSSIIDAGSRTVRTNFPQDRLREMLSISQSTQGDDAIQRVVLGPPYAKNPPAGTPGGYQLVLDMDRLAKLSIKLFGADSSYATATP